MRELDATGKGRRQHEVLLVAERCGPGVRAKRICELAGVTDRTLRHWLAGDEDFRRDWRACRAPKARQLWEQGIALMYATGDGRGLMQAEYIFTFNAGEFPTF